MLEISRSYQRLVQHEFIGGKKFESSTFFSAYKQSDIRESTSPEGLAKISDNLFALAKKEVDRAVDALEEEIKNAKPF